MTTEVRIKKCRSYLPYLGRIMSCIASRLGMNTTEIREAECAVEKACLSSIDSESDIREDLIIRFDSSDSCLTVDITDPVLLDGLDRMSVTPEQGRTADAAYDIDTIRSSTGKMIRIVCAGRSGANRTPQLSMLEIASVTG